VAWEDTNGFLIGKYILIAGGVTDPFGDNTYATGYIQGVGTLTFVEGTDLGISQFYDGSTFLIDRRWNGLKTNLSPKNVSIKIKGNFYNGDATKQQKYELDEIAGEWVGDFLEMWDDPEPNENNRYELEIKFMI
jgi:hypothetical protein